MKINSTMGANIQLRGKANLSAYFLQQCLVLISVKTNNNFIAIIRLYVDEITILCNDADQAIRIYKYLRKNLLIRPFDQRQTNEKLLFAIQPSSEKPLRKSATYKENYQY